MPFADNSLIRSEHYPEVYVVRGNIRHWVVSEAQLASYGGRGAVQLLPETEVRSLPLGAREGRLKDGTLIQALNSSDNYFVLFDGVRYHIEDEDLLPAFGGRDAVIGLHWETVDRLPFGGRYDPAQPPSGASALGIALSGGGAMGDFQVGALHYLLYRAGLEPAVISATSVGAVNGLKLLEGEGAPDRGLAGLSAIWLDLDRSSEWFVPQPYLEAGLQTVRLARQYLLDIASEHPVPVPAGIAQPHHDLLGRLRSAEAAAQRRRIESLEAGAEREVLAALGSLAAMVAAGPAGWLALGIGGSALSPMLERLLKESGVFDALFSMEPLRRLASSALRLDLVAQQAAAGRKLRIAAVALGSGELRYVSESGDLLKRDGAPMLTSATAPACRELEAEVKRLQALLTATRPTSPQRQESEHILDRRADLQAALSEFAACRAANPPAPVPVRVPLIDAMMASAAIPAYFPPVRLGFDTYVDGGVREVTPVDILMRTGATRVVAIVASAPGLGAWTGPGNLATVALRALSAIAVEEISRDDIDRRTSWGDVPLSIIRPRLDIHSVFVAYPAFIRNRMAYGFMCAADALNSALTADARAQAEAAADQIAVLRYHVARLDCWIAGEPVPPLMVRLPAIIAGDIAAARAARADFKQRIAALVQLRRSRGAELPTALPGWDEDPARWSAADVSEAHPWNRQRAARAQGKSAAAQQAAGDAVQIFAVSPGSAGQGTRGERVSIVNTGAESLALSGWTLRDASRNSFTFPAVVLEPGAELRIWTGHGAADERNLFWGRSTPVWNNAADTAWLIDPQGRAVSRFDYREDPVPSG